MIKIKTEVNGKMLENFQHEAFSDISIITTSTKINLVLAYLAIDSAFFAGLEPDIVEVDLSHLPEQALLQTLRALYGDQLFVDSVSQLQDTYRVISELQIDDYKESIECEIVKTSELMENLEILQFCFHNNLLLEQLKVFHFQNNLRALEDNRNFLQLNKITLNTLIPILVEFFALMGEESFYTINNILENYFNRNNIRAAEFFQDNEVLALQTVWQQFHHTLQIYDRKPTKSKMSESFIEGGQSPNISSVGINKRDSFNFNDRSFEERKILEEKDKRIAFLKEEIDSKEKLIDKLRKELHEVRKAKNSPINSSKRANSIPVLHIQDDEVSILEGVKNSKKEQVFRNQCTVDESFSEQAFKNELKDVKGHRLGPHPKISRS